MSKPYLDGASNGCPTWIRTMTRRVKVACATITPSGSEVRKGDGAVRSVSVKDVNDLLAIHRKWVRQVASHSGTTPRTSHSQSRSLG
jgi:hypothetical protein